MNTLVYLNTRLGETPLVFPGPPAPSFTETSPPNKHKTRVLTLRQGESPSGKPTGDYTVAFDSAWKELRYHGDRLQSKTLNATDPRAGWRSSRGSVRHMLPIHTYQLPVALWLFPRSPNPAQAPLCWGLRQHTGRGRPCSGEFILSRKMLDKGELKL